MFTLLCIATAVLCAVLFAVFLIAPGAYMALYSVTADASAVFIGRRASPLFLGLAVVAAGFEAAIAVAFVLAR